MRSDKSEAQPIMEPSPQTSFHQSSYDSQRNSSKSPPTNKSLLTTVLLGQPHREKRIISGESSGREVDYDPRIAIPRSPVKHFKKTIDI
ncbi:hypothetical protein AKJ35_01000 [candidate division MSBL1 archaeon SCGC-AAA833F18]|uniref:Uncharacterized protein n=1 Tax=candidate division MSBL1 archaeon SCGC-AAA833F18 TaxID=1698257 RepID=A0A133VSA9_9EURY|nr:hypothetical protein AKJ35_01000 [candidate division MSBL1 archaeon SCGC-AAA833F18]